MTCVKHGQVSSQFTLYYIVIKIVLCSYRNKTNVALSHKTSLSFCTSTLIKLRFIVCVSFKLPLLIL